MAKKEFYPVTPVQKTIYMNCQKLQDTELYHNQTILNIRGPLEHKTLEKAWNSVLKKHPTLTHTFHIHGSEVVQRKNEVPHQKIPLLDDAEFYPELARRKSVMLNLEKAPLVYLLLTCKNNNEFKIALGFHHIVLDGFSNRILWNDLFETYKTGTTCSEATNTSFYQFIEEEKQSKHISFKQNQESNIDQIFLDHYRNKASPLQIQENFHIPSTVEKKIIDICKQLRCTLATFFITAWVYCLSRLGSKREINFSVISDGRDADIQNIESSIGMFIKALPIYLNWDHSTCMSELIQKTQESLMDARSNQFTDKAFEVPLDTLISVVNFDPENYLSFPFPNFQISFEKEFDKSHDPLVLNINVHPESLSFQIAALNSHFTHSSLKIMRRAFSNLMENIVEGDLNITSEEETEAIMQLCYSSAHTKTYSVQDLLSSNVEKNGSRVAVSDGMDEMMYQELEILSNRFANHLVAKGVSPKETVALVSMRGKKAVTAMTALWKVGANFVPIDISMPEERIHLILQKLDPSVIIYTDTKEKFSVHNRIIQYDDAIDCSSNFHPRVDLNTLKAYLIFSSGSSGNPKLTEINHQSINQLMRAWQDTYSILNSPIRLLQIGSFGFDVFIGDWLKVLLSHGTLFIIPEKDRYSPKAALECIFQNQIDVFESTPSFVKPILELSEQYPDFTKSLKLIILGSEACYVSEAYKLCHQAEKGLRIVNGYGLTEAAIESGVFECSSYNLEQIESPFLPVGLPLQGQGIYVLDHEQKPLPFGVIGNLYIGGSGVGEIHPNNSERYFANPFHPGYLYNTGDRAALNPKGFIEFCGRSAFMTKIRGFRIDLGEIENKVLELNGVEKAVVIPYSLGEYDALALFVQTDVDKNYINSYLSKHFPPYMLPTQIQCEKSLLLNSNGKIDRRTLLEKTRSFQFELSEALSIEQTITGIWESILKIKVKSSRVSFFDYGGNSIQISELYETLKNHFQIDISITDLFSNPSINDQTKLVEEELVLN